jgi:hypothetical protein
MDQLEEYLYIFSCEGVIQFKMNIILKNVNQILNFTDNFYGYELYKKDNMFISISRYQGIRIYEVTFDKKLSFIQKILKFN